MDSLRNRAVSAINDRFYYGWLMVGVAGIGMFCSGPGQSYTFSVFIEPISRDLGISKTSIASAYAIATLAAAFLLPRAGKLLDRFGPRQTLLIVSICLGLACMFFGAAANFIWLAIGFAMLRFMGQGATMLTVSNLVSQWFLRRRGFAMSLMGLGFAASMAIHPLIGEHLISAFGWRTAWVVLGPMTWALMIPPLLLVFNKPEAVGLAIDGDAIASTEGETPTIEGLELPQAKKETAFYILCAVWFVVGGLVTVLHFFQVSVLSAQGMDSATAARLFSISAITMVITMPFIGKIYDSLRTRYVVAFEMMLIGLALIAITQVTGFASGVVYSVTFGLANAFMLTMFGFIWPRYFGRAHLGSIQGVGQMAGVIGASIAPLPVGYAIDSTGSASTILTVLALVSFMVGVYVILKLRTPAGITIPGGVD